MKKFYILSFLLLFSFITSYSQVSKCRAYGYSYKIKKDSGYWTDWSDLEDVDILIVFNFEKDRIQIYSAEFQEYDIYDIYDEVVDSDGDTTHKMSCVDKDGLRCSLRLLKRNNGMLQLYIDYNDAYIAYDIYSLD